MKSYQLRRAERTLRAGNPLSLDQVMALSREGIDARVVEQNVQGGDIWDGTGEGY